MGTPLPLPKRGRSPRQFSAHIYCGQTAGLMKLVLGMVVGLSPGDFVLDGDPAPPQKRGRTPSPIIGPFLLSTNGWMHQDATWYGDRPQPRRLSVRWGPSPLHKKGGKSPIFGPCLLRPNGCVNEDAIWNKGRPQPRRHCVTWGPSSPPQKRAEPPIFCPFYCGQMAGCIKMPFGIWYEGKLQPK